MLGVWRALNNINKLGFSAILLAVLFISAVLLLVAEISKARDDLMIDYDKLRTCCSQETESSLLINNVSIVNPTDVKGGVVTIDYEHHEIHEGKHFFIKNWQDVEETDTSLQYSFITPNSSTQIHARVILFGEAEFDVEIWECATLAENGTLLTPINNFRNSTYKNKLLPFSDPSVSDPGTLIWAEKLGSARGNVGVNDGLNYEIIAQPDCAYLFNITKQTSGTHYVDIDFFWYEEGIE